MRLTRFVFAAAVVLALLGGCGHVLSGFDYAKEHACVDASATDEQVEVRYLGSGGVYIRWRGEAILLGASFSNPGMVRALLLRPKANDSRIEHYLKPLDLKRVRAILAAHSHYDHIGDLPAVAKRVPQAKIYLNSSGMQIVQSERDLRTRAIEIAPKEWVQVASSIRVRAVESDHAPQLCPWRRWPCVYAPVPVKAAWEEDSWTKHKLRAFGGGSTLAFVIELWDENQVRYRIYYNEAAADSPAGQIEGDFDLAILCIAQWNWVRDYPRDLLAVLRPRHVMVSHWDNFFSTGTTSARFVPNLSNASAERFIDVVRNAVKTKAGPVNAICGAHDTGWTMPVVGSTLVFSARTPPAPPPTAASAGRIASASSAGGGRGGRATPRRRGR